MYKQFITLSLSLFALGCTCQAQEYEFSAAACKATVVADGYVKDYVRSNNANYYKLSASWRTSKDSASIYDRLWKRPQIEAGIILADYSRTHLHKDDCKYTPVPYNSGMGYVYTAFAAFRRDLLRTPRLSLGYKLENGVGISSRPYDIHDNVDNIFIGARASFFVGLGAYASWKVSPEWSIGIDAGFRHYSNGRTAMPNKGANTLDIGLQASYRLSPDTTFRPVSAKAYDLSFCKHLYLDLSGGWAPQVQRAKYSYEEDHVMPEQRSEHYKLHSAIASSAALMYRYNRKFSSGMGIDYMYVPYTDEIIETENAVGLTQSEAVRPNVWALAAHHEAFYKQMSLHASIGYYLYRHVGEKCKNDDTPYYETVGLRWYPNLTNQRLYIGYNIRAHNLKAACMQLSLGYNIGL